MIEDPRPDDLDPAQETASPIPGPRVVLGIGPRGSVPTARQVWATRRALARISPSLTLKPLFTATSGDELNSIEDRARKYSRRYRPAGLARYYVVDPPPGFAGELLRLTARFPTVVTAYIEPGPVEPPAEFHPNPDVIEQIHLKPAPEGINARNAWDVPGGGGQGISLGIVEQGWEFDHPDLLAAAPQLVHGVNHSHRGHGVSVLGLLRARPETQGCEGIVRGALSTLLASQYRTRSEYNTADAVAQLISRLGPGDVLLLETQTEIAVSASLTNPNLMKPVLVPSEVEPAIFDLLVAAEATGITVVEAAGNGKHDLDTLGPLWGNETLDPTQPGFLDSGAILVAAANVPKLATGQSPQRMQSSNYGSRIDCFAAGQSVETLDEGQAHRHTFSGTSSAAAIIAGAAAVFQGMYRARHGAPAPPNLVRSVLSASTGTAAIETMMRPGWIGFMPDLLAIDLAKVPPGTEVAPAGLTTVEVGAVNRPLVDRPVVDGPDGREIPGPGTTSTDPIATPGPATPQPGVTSRGCCCPDRCPRCGKRRC